VALHWPNAEKILWIEPHPLLAQVALGLAADGQQAEFAQSTYLTTDFGQTWVRIGGNTTFQTQFGCESEACPYRTAIIYQQAPTGAQWDDCRSGMCNLHRVLFDPAKPSASTLAKPTQIGDSINGLGEVHWPWYDRLAASVLFVSSRICENTDGCHSPDDYKQRVRFSLNGGISWTRALFPFDATHTMRFVTSESGVLLVGVRHHDQAAEAEYGDLYVSSTGAVEDGFFVRSLRHVYMSPKMWWENSMFAGQLAVERSSELDGVLIANRYRSLADGTADTNCLQSVITFDLGATWSPDQGAARRVLDRRLLPARAAQLERVSDQPTRQATPSASGSRAAWSARASIRKPPRTAPTSRATAAPTGRRCRRRRSSTR
jgi:hypothetical protein